MTTTPSDASNSLGNKKAARLAPPTSAAACSIGGSANPHRGGRHGRGPLQAAAIGARHVPPRHRAAAWSAGRATGGDATSRARSDPRTGREAHGGCRDGCAPPPARRRRRDPRRQGRRARAGRSTDEKAAESRFRRTLSLHAPALLPPGLVRVPAALAEHPTKEGIAHVRPVALNCSNFVHSWNRKTQ